MIPRVLVLVVAAVASADAFSGPISRLPVSTTSRESAVKLGNLCVRMRGDEGRSNLGRRDALGRGASVFLAAGLPWVAGAEEGQESPSVEDTLGYDIPSELDSWKGWNAQRSFRRAGRNFDIEQRFADNRQNGMTVYEGNEAMTEYMESLGRPFFEGKSVLELGTGTGFGSMVAFTLGARKVTATDRNPKVLELADANFRRNIRDTRDRTLNTRPLLWGADKCIEGESWKQSLGFCWNGISGIENDPSFDVIIGSDLTYSEGVLPDLIKTLKDFMHKDSEVILVWCEPKLFTWNTDVMSRLNRGIETFDNFFDAKVLVSNKKYNSHPDTTIVKLKLNDAKPGYPPQVVPDD
mmetsp:Transcript_25481/g.59030  ORF Transcript_25481/g.59030 Transcript_25481/m.59030 type:complete len:351 (+) Transcript_25481:148-1200(+)|eukprot:CAMPEP_0114142252 /NCGR_PEP_ID=MMETSP0043_2-20121206/18350_1 /TAXON_ID=464988 /ORGANISM="Hemiselmis andersenii, Strain CCMP644" /LENGTH=350 /DNA_ID=CAMNT_0001236463 /DNA_START=124 /DNA_END=1176 /DNA_ORIENTATION=-